MILNFNDQARILQIKDDSQLKPGSKMYYVHIMDYEKRMDRWVNEKSIRQIIGYCDLSGVSNNKMYLYQFFA